MKALLAVLLLAVLLLGAAEVVLWSRLTGHSIAHVTSLGFVPDEPRRPFRNGTSVFWP